jgi:hypothetical protein
LEAIDTPLKLCCTVAYLELSDPAEHSRLPNTRIN